jgi:hypothetical protein
MRVIGVTMSAVAVLMSVVTRVTSGVISAVLAMMTTSPHPRPPPPPFTCDFFLHACLEFTCEFT